MNEDVTRRSKGSAIALFFTLFFLVFTVVVITATLITFILPESFASTARIKVEESSTNSTANPDARSFQSHYDPYLAQTEVEVIQSELILGKVVEELELNTEWGKKYAGGEKLKTAESMALLRARLDSRPIANTSIIQIRFFSENPSEAAKLANATVRIYVQRTHSPSSVVKAEVIDSAVPGMRPVRPNKPLNIALGILVGGILGVGAGALGAWTMYSWGRRARKPPPLP